MVAGYTNRGSPTGHDFAVARFKPNGKLDKGFSGDGRATMAIASGYNDDEASSVAIQRDGKIVVAGYSYNAATIDDFSVARFKANGKPDKTFAGDGGRLIDFAGGPDLANGLAIQPNGKIVIVGSSYQGATTGTDLAVARLKANGNLDKSFSGDGLQTTDFGNGAAADAGETVAIQPDGRLVVVGWSDQGGSTGTDYALARFKPNGKLDKSFSGDGRTTLDFAGVMGLDIGRSVAVQHSGKIVVGGQATEIVASGSEFGIARFKANGKPDKSFSGDGRTTVDFNNDSAGDTAYGMAIQGDGRIVLAGATGMVAGYDRFAVARLKPQGAVDHSFSGNGRTAFHFPGSAGDDIGSAGVAVRTGKIIVAGYSAQGPTTGDDFAVAQLKGN